MTTPQPPSVEFNVLSQIIPPAYDRHFRILLVGRDEGTVAAAVPLVNGQIYGPFNAIDGVGGLDNHVPADSDLFYAAKAIFDHGITPDIWVTQLPDLFLIADVTEAIQLASRISPPVDFIYLVDTTNGGYAAAGAQNMAVIEAQLNTTCELLDCIGIMDALDVSEAQYVTWISTPATRPMPRIRPIFNRVLVSPGDYRGAAGWFLGAALRQASRFGRQAGINTVQALGIGELQRSISFSILKAVDTDIKNIVNNYGSAVFRGDSGNEIIGDTFFGYDEGDPLRYWGARVVVDYAVSQMQRAIVPHLGNDTIGNTPAYRRGLARHANEAADQLVINGELLNARVRPHPTKNNQIARQAREVHLQAFLTVILATNSAIVEVNITV